MRRADLQTPSSYLGLIRDHRAQELRQRPRDALVGDLRIAEGLAKQLGIPRVGGEDAGQFLQVLPHLEPVLDRHQHHRLEVAAAFIPEEPGPRVKPQVDEVHRMAIRQPACESFAEPVRIDERMRLHVAGSAGHRAVRRQPRVVEKHPAERRPGVGDRIVGWRVVEVLRRAFFEVTGQIQIGVLIRKLRQAERSLGCRNGDSRYHPDPHADDEARLHASIGRPRATPACLPL